MANIKNITTGNQYIDGYIDAWETKESDYILTNETKVHAVVYLHRNNSWNGNTYSDQVWRRLKINGVNVFEVTGNVTVPPKASGYVKIAEGSTTVKHDTDGSKKVSISIESTDNLSSTPTAFDISLQSGELTLTKIPRYATSNQSLNSKTETTITMNWSSDNTIDYVWYSTDWGTTWKAVGSVNAKSGSYTINYPSNSTNKLSANTTYNVITRVRRKDSQLTTDSSKLSVTTYDYPHCTNSPNFTIGNSLTLSFYNPLGRSINWQVLGNDNSIIAGNTTTGTSYTGINGEGSIANLYASIPNAKSGTYKVKVTYGSSEKTTTGGTYSIKGTETPTIGTITYADTNATVTAITGNNQHIVQNQSNLKVSFTSATAKNSASISKHTFTLNGVTKTSTSSSGSVDFGKINSSSNLTLTIVVTDSRGLTSKTTKTITMLAHNDPSAIVTLKRLNNYEDETYLTVDGSIASVNGKNKMTIKYRYKVSGGTYGDYITISDNVKQTLSLNKENIYMFNVVITDSFGATYNQEHSLNKGVFPLFIDTELNSVGVNRLPLNENSFEVNGTIYIEDIKCKNLLYTPYTETNKLTDTATKDDYTVKTNYYCYLEEGKKYTFSCKTDAVWGGSTSTDTVEVFLLKDNAYDLYISVNTNPKTFTVTETGYYFVRYDINKNGVTHSFWDMQIEEGDVATNYVEAKEFSNKQVYSLGEIIIGRWVTGQPIYRNVLIIPASNFGTGTASSGTSINIPHNVANIGIVLREDLIWERTTTVKQKRILPSNFYGDAGWDGQMFVDTTNIQCELGTSILNAMRNASYIYAILEYTKETD